MHPIQPNNNLSASSSSNSSNERRNRNPIVRRNRTQNTERIEGEISNLEAMQFVPADIRQQFIGQILEVINNPPPRNNSDSSLSNASIEVRFLEAIPEEGHVVNNDDNRSLSDVSSIHNTNHISGDSFAMDTQTDTPSNSIINQEQIRRNRLSEHYGMDNNNIDTSIFDSNSHNAQQPR